MKFKTLAIGLMAISLLGAANTEAYAQRKTTKKTATSSPKSSTTPKKTTTPSGPALNCDSLTYCDYLAWTDLNSGNGLLTHSGIRLNKYYFHWNAGDGTEFIGTWGISGNKLQLKSTSSIPITYNLESSNEGESFTGTMFHSGKNVKGDAYLYEQYEVDEPWTETDIIEFFKDGEVIGFLEIYIKDLFLGVPVTVSFEYDEDNDKKGFIKLQSTAPAFTMMGFTKLPFDIGETAISFIDRDGKDKSYNYDELKNNFLFFRVGNAPQSSLGKGSLYLCLIPNPDN